MGMEENKSKLTAKQGMQSAGSSDGIGHPGHGFKMPAGSNGQSSGAALPVSSRVDDDPMCPSSEGPAEDNDEDMSMVEDAAGGKIKA